MLDKALLVAPGFLLVLISLFAITGNNHPHVDRGEIALLALGLLAGFALFFLLIWRTTRDFSRAAKALTYTAILWLLFIFASVLGKHFWQVRFDIPAAGLLLAALAGLLLLSRRSLPFNRDTQRIFLVFSLITLLLQLPQLLKIEGNGRDLPRYDDVESALAGKTAASLPHVVYIVPDRYAGDGALRDFYGYDNSGFSEALRERGFHVWDRQLANYPKTFQSMAATMNMNYLDELTTRLGPEETSYVPVYRLIEDNQTLRVLQRHGYGYIHLGNKWDPTRTNRRADHHVTYENRFREFTSLYLSMTPATFLDALAGGTKNAQDMCALINRQADAIVEQAAQSEKPLFFFWHLFSVHEPYLYDENGACRDYWEYGLKGQRDNAGQYLNQITHANRMLLDVFDRLQAASDREVIFMILSDEGPFPWNYVKNQDRYAFQDAPGVELQQKFSIYSAIYLPSGDYPHFEAEQTSINAFRLVFNEIFAADLPLLEHKNYCFNLQTHPYDLKEITARLRNKPH